MQGSQDKETSVDEVQSTRNKSGRGETFHTRSSGPGAHRASYTVGTGSFLAVKQPGHGVNHPPPSSAEVKERVEPYLYSWSVPSQFATG